MFWRERFSRWAISVTVSGPEPRRLTIISRFGFARTRIRSASSSNPRRSRLDGATSGRSVIGVRLAQMKSVIRLRSAASMNEPTLPIVIPGMSSSLWIPMRSIDIWHAMKRTPCS